MSCVTSLHCRLCAKTKPSSEIINLSSDIHIRNEIVDKLAIFTINTIDFRDRTLPETVCIVCRKNVYDSYEFYEEIKNAQIVLKRLTNIVYSSQKHQITNSNEFQKEEKYKEMKVEKLTDPFNDNNLHYVECGDFKLELDDNEDVESNIHENYLSPIAHTNKIDDSQTPSSNVENELKVESQSETDFECTACGHTLPTWKELVRHTTTEHPKKNQTREALTCDNYIKEFATKEDLYYQLKKGDGNEKNNINTSDDLECDICFKTFSLPSKLRYHKTKHKTNKDYQRTTDTTFKRKRKATIEELTCDICYKVFSIPAKLKYHKVLHTERSRDYVCDVCGKAFYTKDTLNTHKIIHNPGSLDCKVCKKTFISLIRLRKHLKTHDMTKPYECNDCQRRFRLKYQLSKHMVVHSNVFPYSCEYCKKGFRFKNVLKTHENIHTGAKPFVCSVCGMDFTNWSNCNKHMVRKHGVSMAKRVKTAHGLMPLNQETLQPKEVDLESVKWSEQMCKPRKRGRKKQQEENPT